MIFSIKVSLSHLISLFFFITPWNAMNNSFPSCLFSGAGRPHTPLSPCPARLFRSFLKPPSDFSRASGEEESLGKVLCRGECRQREYLGKTERSRGRQEARRSLCYFSRRSIGKGKVSGKWQSDLVAEQRCWQDFCCPSVFV